MKNLRQMLREGQVVFGAVGGGLEPGLGHHPASRGLGDRGCDRQRHGCRRGKDSRE